MATGLRGRVLDDGSWDAWKFYGDYEPIRGDGPGQPPRAPEPVSLTLLALGVGGLLAARGRRR